MKEEKKDIHKGFKIFIIIFIMVALLLFQEENQKKISSFFAFFTEKQKSLELVDSFQNQGDILDVNIKDNTVSQWKFNKLSIFDIDEMETIYKDFNFVDPVIYYGKENIYIIDKSTGDIYFLNKQGENMDKLQLDKEIFNFEESYENIIFHERSSEVENISILNKDKVLIGNYSYEDKDILTYATNKKGSRNTIASMDLNDGRLKSHIDIYGENNEKIKEISIYDEIVVYLKIISKDETVVLTDSGIHFIKEDEIIWDHELNLIKDIYITENEIYLLYSNYLERIDFEGNQKGKMGFPEEYTKILAFERNILLYGKDHMVIINEDKEILKHEEEIIKISMDKDNILLLGPEGLKLYKIINKK